MPDELPASTIAEIAFVGRGGGLVKSLGGFKKGHHTLPDATNAATQAFLAKICAGELREEGETLFQAVRAALKYKRADIALSVASPAAVLTAKDFVVEMAYALEADDATRYATTFILRALRSAHLARTEEFDSLFARRFTEISFGLARGAQVEAVIDAIEGLDEAAGLAVQYPSDYHECEISVDGVEAHVRCTGAALEMVFPRAGSPAELIDAFADVRSAFAVSPPLRAMLG